MSKSTEPSTRVKSTRPLSSCEERTVSVRAAIGLVLAAERVAFAVTVNSHGNSLLVDVSKASAARHLRQLHGRVKRVNVSDLFGTTVIG